MDISLATQNVREQEIARGMITVPDGAGLGLALKPGLEKRADAISRFTRL